jgi:hypothetical protein
MTLAIVHKRNFISRQQQRVLIVPTFPLAIKFPALLFR